MGDDAGAAKAPEPKPIGVVRLAFALVLFLPFGVIAAWCSWRASQSPSVRAVRWARRWSLAAIIVGAVLSAVLFLLLGLLGAFPRS